MIKVKVFVRAQDEDFGGAVTGLLEGADCVIVDSPDKANYVVDVRSSSEATSSGSQYNMGNVTGSAVGNNATRYGDISGGNVVIGGSQHIGRDLNIAQDSAKQQINNSSGLSDKQKAELTDLMDMLYPALKRAANKDDEAAVKQLKEKADALAKAAADEQPAWHDIKIKAEGLVAAAKNLAVATPYVLPIAQEILKFSAQYAG